MRLSVAEMLARVAHQYGTPCYVYDVRRLHQQVAHLQASVPAGVDVLYSLKANPSLGLCGLMAGWGLGADVASLGELLVALAAGFPPARVLVGGPALSPDTLEHLQHLPEALVSVDSLGELRMLAERGQSLRLLLRLRPDFYLPAAVATGPDARFGIPFDDLERCRATLTNSALTVVGFHVFSGSQLLDGLTIQRHLRGAVTLCLRASERLGIAPQILNLGGGFGVPYEPGEPELDLSPLAQELSSLLDQVAPGRLVLELGRYLVAQAGWYLTTVLTSQQRASRQTVVVDGGIHQRADLCRLGLRTQASPPLVLHAHSHAAFSTDVQGCLCLPDDVLLEAGMLPELAPGTLLAFPNAGAYGFSASPLYFLGHPIPPEVAFDGEQSELLRARQPAQFWVETQRHLHRVPGA